MEQVSRHPSITPEQAARLAVALLAASGAIGCTFPDEESMSGDEGALAEAESAYEAVQSCTERGGGTWGAILRMCVTISGDVGRFEVTKSDGSSFVSAGTMYLKVGTRESWGFAHEAQTINGGVYSVRLGDNFSQWPDFPKDYFARFESEEPGVAWVGPIRIKL